MTRKLRPSPALVIASVALFFAIGGSAFAVVQKTEAAQARCSPGAVRGIAYVTGDGNHGIANTPQVWQSGNQYFGYRWNCSGGVVQVKSDGSGFDVRFVGNSSTTAMATPVASTAAGISVSRLADGSFHIETAGDAPDASFPSRQSFAFVIVAL